MADNPSSATAKYATGQQAQGSGRPALVRPGFICSWPGKTFLMRVIGSVEGSPITLGLAAVPSIGSRNSHGQRDGNAKSASALVRIHLVGDDLEPHKLGAPERGAPRIYVAHRRATPFTRRVLWVASTWRMQASRDGER